ncbi:caffeoyl-CoA O-methyltransferase [Allocatelliglobosispora scoriae]|uniref:Caffeoyl-CoA O-methyltransferase n=1 Tax=Allocatelliglobosispora scoriae TaxID=643052 RepID=A0A841BTU3_9ACTN|nr:O-methyltransferase [Allocatelliglobosispora scoriae]MBB5871624.1 caffeoyl-CoA O-methyltransferase [Allocatelliglobosispora scoriae]
MSRQSITLDTAMHDYLVAHGTPPDDILTELAEETARALGGVSRMQISPEQAALFTLLAASLNVRNAVEVGTFTGLSSLALARGMAPGGKLVCFDISEEYTSIARRYWARAGVDDRIELRLGAAAELLPELPNEAYLDFVFIDADKPGYATYWGELVPRLRQGGIIAVDNVLWSGRVLDPASEHDESTAAIVAFNDMVAADKRVQATMLPIGDGLTLARKL